MTDNLRSKESNENLPRSTEVKSSLRDRIIAALVQADQDWCSDNPLYEDEADAVIEALGLTRVTRSQNPPIHRWVTEWEPSD